LEVSECNVIPLATPFERSFRKE
jgi:hypothetical protein